MLFQKLKFRRKRKGTNYLHASNDFEISTEDEEKYLDLNSSTLSCLNYVQYADYDLNNKVSLVNRSKSFQETGALMSSLRKQRVCDKCDRSSSSSNMNGVGDSGWTFIELNDRDLNVFCDKKRCSLIKKKRFYDRFFNPIRIISQGCRKSIHNNSSDERGELILTFIYITLTVCVPSKITTNFLRGFSNFDP